MGAGPRVLRLRERCGRLSAMYLGSPYAGSRQSSGGTTLYCTLLYTGKKLRDETLWLPLNSAKIYADHTETDAYNNGIAIVYKGGVDLQSLELLDLLGYGISLTRRCHQCHQCS